MSGIGVGVGIGAGVGVSSVALAPFNAANTFMGSAFFGYGMILGERYAYQADWPKIQARLENGEKIENIIQEYTGRFSAVVMKEAKIIFESVTEEFIDIITNAIKNALDPTRLITGPTIDPNAPTIGDPRRKKPTFVPKPKFDPNNPVIPVIPKPVVRPPKIQPLPPKTGKPKTIDYLTYLGIRKNMERILKIHLDNLKLYTNYLQLAKKGQWKLVPAGQTISGLTIIVQKHQNLVTSYDKNVYQFFLKQYPRYTQDFKNR